MPSMIANTWIRWMQSMGNTQTENKFVRQKEGEGNLQATIGIVGNIAGIFLAAVNPPLGVAAIALSSANGLRSMQKFRVASQEAQKDRDRLEEERQETIREQMRIQAKAEQDRIWLQNQAEEKRQERERQARELKEQKRREIEEKDRQIQARDELILRERESSRVAREALQNEHQSTLQEIQEQQTNLQENLERQISSQRVTEVLERYESNRANSRNISSQLNRISAEIEGQGSQIQNNSELASKLEGPLREISQNLGRLSIRLGENSSEVEPIRTAIEEMKRQIQNLKEAEQQAAQSGDSAKAAAESVAETTGEINNSLNSMRSVNSETIRMTRKLMQQVTKLEEKIRRFEDKEAQLLRVLQATHRGNAEIVARITRCREGLANRSVEVH